MKTNNLIFIALVSFSVLAMSCKRDRDDSLLRSAKDNSTSENMFDDVVKQAADGLVYAEDSASGTRSQYHELVGGCATVTISPFDNTTFPKTITVDFGSSNCLGTDGRYRRGAIQMVASGWYRDSGTVITIAPQNYYVNDNLVSGNKTVSNLGHNGSGNLNYSISVNGSIITSEGTISWTSSRNREWIQGEDTYGNPWDDVYLITGSANGTNVEGGAFTVTIITPLQIQVGCRWIQAGSLKLESESKEVVIDYGNGSCDGDAVVTINGNTYNIVML